MDTAPGGGTEIADDSGPCVDHVTGFCAPELCIRRDRRVRRSIGFWGCATLQNAFADAHAAVAELRRVWEAGGMENLKNHAIGLLCSIGLLGEMPEYGIRLIFGWFRKAKTAAR